MIIIINITIGTRTAEKKQIAEEDIRDTIYEDLELGEVINVLKN